MGVRGRRRRGAPLRRGDASEPRAGRRLPSSRAACPLPRRGRPHARIGRSRRRRSTRTALPSPRPPSSASITSEPTCRPTPSTTTPRSQPSHLRRTRRVRRSPSSGMPTSWPSDGRSCDRRAASSGDAGLSALRRLHGATARPRRRRAGPRAPRRGAGFSPLCSPFAASSCSSARPSPDAHDLDAELPEGE